MRVLGALRLSRDADESTSIERQREQITAWATMRGYTVAAWSTDTDVSGSVSPFERPGLGPYLRTPGIETWDVLAAAKLDRITRSVGDWSALADWATRHGKTLASIAESLDLTTSAGRGMANVTATFAQMERERIAERCRESRVALAKAGRYAGGPPPFGYRAVKTSTGWTLEQNPETAPYAAELADRCIAGDSNPKLAAWLDAQGVPSARGKTWNPQSVRVVLLGHALAGYASSKGQRVRDEDGSDVRITAEPILSDETWRKVQAALKSRTQVRAERRNGSHLLLRVIYCRKCSTEAAPAPMYARVRQGHGKNDYYACNGCGLYLPKGRTEDTLEALLLDKIGDRDMVRAEYIPAESHTSELEELDAKIADLDDTFARGDLPASAYGRMMKRLEADRDKLAALPQTPAGTVYTPTGQTVAEHWAGLDQDARGAFLRSWGVRMLADRKGARLVLGWEREGQATLADAFGLTA